MVFYPEIRKGTNDGRYTCEIKSRTAMTKVAFNKKRAHFTSTMDLELRKKLVKCHTPSCFTPGKRPGNH
jgi:hypothetical protein